MSQFEVALQGIVEFFTQPDASLTGLRLIIIFAVTLLTLYAFNRLVAALTPKLSETVTKRADIFIDDADFLRMRRLETFVGLGLAMLRVGVILGVLYFAWRLTNPTIAPIAIVGASTIFFVLGGATLAPLLRDITYGFIMILERWYNVGDHIVVDPFIDMAGVVERVTLRSTKLRSVNGEVIWLHNQHIQGVRVSPAATRTHSVEIFVNDKERGIKIIKEAAKVSPSSSVTLPQPLMLAGTTQLDEKLWRITAVCGISPTREWIVDGFVVDAIKKADELSGTKPCIIYGPIAYYSDPIAEKRFRRSVRAGVAETAVAATTTLPKQSPTNTKDAPS